MHRYSRLGIASLAGLLLAALTMCVPEMVVASDDVHTGVVGEDAVDWTPHLAQVGSVRPVAYSISQAGDYMVVGGRFSAVHNRNRTVQLDRQNVFAFNATTGEISPFAPAVNKEVWTVLGQGDSVYIGGNFSTVNGQTRRLLAKLSLSTGQLDPKFKPVVPGGRVTDLEMVDGRLIVSGAFTKKLVALDPATGQDTGYLTVPITNPLQYTTRTEVFRFDVSTDGQHLVGVGNFQTVGGATHYRAFMLDLGETTATVSPWRYTPLERNCHAATNPVYQMYLRDVDFSADGSYFVTASTGGHRINGEGPGLVLCDSTARFETANLTPAKPTWINYTGGDTLHSVATSGAAVYVQGHSRWLDNPQGADFPGPGALDRMGGGAVDPVTGKALAWNPVMPQQIGGWQILVTDAGVWFATDGMYFGGEYHRGIRFVPAP